MTWTSGRRRDERDLASPRTAAARHITPGRPGQELRPEHEAGLALPKDERAVRKVLEKRLVEAVCPHPRLDPLSVELLVHRVGADLAGVQVAPARREAHEVLAPAERAGAVPGGERRHLVEEEELGEAARLEQRPLMPVLELQPARDPALAVVAAPDPPGLVVQAALVAVDEPAPRIGDELAEGRHAVLERHRRAA